MHEIQLWINGKKDYSTGVMLYSKYGPYKTVLAMLQKGETQLTRAKLNEALIEVWGTLKKDIATRQKQEQKTITAEPLPITVTGQQPAPVIYAPYDIRGAKDETHKKLIQTANRIYAEMAVYHARLGNCETNEQRFNLAKLILETQTRWIAATKQRDTYANTGKLTRKKRKQKAKDDIKPNELRRLFTMRTAYSNYKNHRLPASEARFAAFPTRKNKKNLERTQAAVKRYKEAIEKLEHGETD